MSTTGIQFESLSRSLARARLRDLLSLDLAIEQDRWGEREFLLELPDKFLHSRLALGPVGEAVGFAIASRKADAVHVHRLAVAQSHRRRGIGLELLRRVAASGRRASLATLTLKVFGDNAEAHRFYEALGFRQGAATPAGHWLEVPTECLCNVREQDSV